MNGTSLGRRVAAILLLAACTATVGCSADSLLNANVARPVTLSIATRASTGLVASKLPTGPSLDVASGPNGSIVVTQGDATLEIDSVNVVFARVVLYKAND